MKKEFLTEQGIAEDIAAKIMTENGKDIENVNRKLTTMTAERDGLQTQLTEVQEKLKGFDGVDVAALKGEITKLNGDLAAAREKHAEEIADRDFQSTVKDAITAAKGRNVKAVLANLDMDALKASKNQTADIAAALEALAASDAYLFEITEQEPTPGAAPAKSSGIAHTPGGGASINPWKKGDGYSLQKQTELFRANPTLARQKAAEAGVRL